MHPKEAVKIALIAAAVLAGVLLLWVARDVLLMIFASVLIATALAAAAEPIEERVGLGRTASLTLVCALLLAGLTGISLLVGTQLASQVSLLFEQLPEAVRSLEQRLGVSLIGEARPDALLSGYRVQEVVNQALSVGRTAVGAISGAIVIVIGAIFLAANPDLYKSGFVKLFPKSEHPRVLNCLDECGVALRLWLIGQLIAMSVVGILVGLGAWFIGLPAPVALGLVAALTELIPIVGPILGAVPALLVAIPLGTDTVLWTLALVVGVQQLESNIITPVVQRRTVEIPPAVLLFALLVIGIVLGLPGVVVAAPLTTVLYVVVKELYVRQTLGIPTPIPGEHHEE